MLLHVLWFSGARRAASRSRLPVPGVAARPVRRGLHVQVQRFPVLGVGEPPGPVPVVNVTLLPHLLDLLLQLLVKAGLLIAHPGLGHLSVCCLE